jgi:predicted molibdopterin-dependent oxidoreductase YjgC
MFARLPDAARAAVAVTIDGEAFDARVGDTVAAALHASGRVATRATPVSGAPRGPFCMMGVCFDCLVTIDDVPNQQACLVLVTRGMRIRTQHGRVALDHPPGART